MHEKAHVLLPVHLKRETPILSQDDLTFNTIFTIKTPYSSIFFLFSP